MTLSFCYAIVGENGCKVSGVRMTTTKLYYEDAYKSSFSTKVIQKKKADDGRLFILLAETAFYPTGGGQPCDIGTINGVDVVEVVEVNREIRHYVEEFPEENDVFCEINWPRRFDYMQQHAGQHILSAAFEDVWSYKTISFHLGKEICTIDLEVPSITNEELEKVELAANRMILANHPIETKWVSQDELTHYNLRKELSVTDNIRLVIIPDIDYNGCGGTHPHSTGQVSGVKILGWEKQKKHIRIQFVCGARVLNQLQAKHTVIEKLTGLLNAPQEEMIQATDKMVKTSIGLEMKVEELTNRLLQYEAKELVEERDHKVIAKVFVGREIQELQQLARAIIHSENENGIETVIIFVVEQEDKTQIVLARTDNIEVNLNVALKEVLALMNGKGGGKPSFVQGGGEKELPADVIVSKLKGMLG